VQVVTACSPSAFFTDHNCDFFLPYVCACSSSASQIYWLVHHDGSKCVCSQRNKETRLIHTIRHARLDFEHQLQHLAEEETSISKHRDDRTSNIRSTATVLAIFHILWITRVRDGLLTITALAVQCFISPCTQRNHQIML
jgi:hypothetical protein